MKVYDREYFEHWYRSPHAIVRPDVVARKVRLALAAVEYVLGRRARSVLDVGCGEGAWRPLLRRLRPGLRYVGVDSSEYAVQRYGRRRGIRRGTLGHLDRLGLKRPFDLVVCADVLEYVPTPEVRAGLRHLRMLTGGLAYIEAFAVTDDMVGDREQWHYRSARAYRELFREADLVPCGLHCYVPRERLGNVAALERCE